MGLDALRSTTLFPDHSQPSPPSFSGMRNRNRWPIATSLLHRRYSQMLSARASLVVSRPWPDSRQDFESEGRGFEPLRARSVPQISRQVRRWKTGACRRARPNCVQNVSRNAGQLRGRAGLDLAYCGTQVVLGHDVVSVEDAPSPVARQLHHNRFGHASSTGIGDKAPTQVVKPDVLQACVSAGPTEHLPNLPPALASGWVGEDVLGIKSPRQGAQCFKRPARQIDDPVLSALRVLRCEADDALANVELLPT